MDVIFETKGGGSFAIVVEIFDTVLEIKEKVQKHQGIPIHRQTLVFNGQVLEDERIFAVMLKPRIQLLFTPEHEPQVNLEQSFPSKKIQLILKIESSATRLEVDVNDTVLQLKERVHFMQSPLAANMLVAQWRGVELQDHRHLRDYGLTDYAEILITRPSPSSSGAGPSATAAAAGSERLMVTLAFYMCGAKIPVEVNASDNVLELRNELEKLQHSPQESYFFRYKQKVMEEYRSFGWHQVSQGDTIEVFPGYRIGGPKKVRRY